MDHELVPIDKLFCGETMVIFHIYLFFYCKPYKNSFIISHEYLVLKPFLFAKDEVPHFAAINFEFCHHEIPMILPLEMLVLLLVRTPN